MVSHRQRVREIERRLGGRRLVYFGTRGTDARSLLEITNFEEVFSQIAPLSGAIQETCLESIRGERVDLDRYSIDIDDSDAVRMMRKSLLRAFSRPAAVIPYRPCAVLASACFTRANLVRYMGLFHEFQACFEHKPWIEGQLAAAGVRVVPWRYFADDDTALIWEASQAGPIVLRTNRSDGGVGLTLVRDPAELEREWPSHTEGFLAVAPFLTPAVPLNVNACVFPDGEVSLHSPSLQLIGLPSCTSRIFGYCGNDFARVADLGPRILGDLESIVVTTGSWLRKQGYLGAFGVDALAHDGKVYLVEVNPRFQGSSAWSARLQHEIDRPDLFLDHMAAFLELPPPPRMSLWEITSCQPALSHVVCHNLAPGAVTMEMVSTDQLPMQCSLLPHPGVRVDPEAILFDAVFPTSVTETGTRLLAEADLQIHSVLYQTAAGQLAAPLLPF